MTDSTTITQKSEHEFQVNSLKRNEAVWLQVENFDLYIKRTDEGIVVDIYDFYEKEREKVLASTYVFDNETASFNPDTEV